MLSSHTHGEMGWWFWNIKNALMNSNSINGKKNYREDRLLVSQKQELFCTWSSFQDSLAMGRQRAFAQKPSAVSCTCQVEPGNAPIFIKSTSFLCWSVCFQLPPLLLQLKVVIKVCIGWCVHTSHLRCVLSASSIEFLCISWLPYPLVFHHVFSCLVFCGRNHLFAVKNG